MLSKLAKHPQSNTQTKTLSEPDCGTQHAAYSKKEQDIQMTPNYQVLKGLQDQS